jgi:tetratricopeptide (TPR) repeat protein
VDYILAGSVRRAADRVRITAQLIQVSDQTHLWAESYERELADVFSIQSEVSKSVARSLALELLPAEQEHLASPRPVNPAAHEAYLKGRYFWNKRTRFGLEEGHRHFERAVELDPRYALAYVGIADSYTMLSTYNIIPPREANPKAKTAALRALEIDNTLAEAHASLAFINHFYDWNWAAAREGFLRALELNPRYGEAHRWYANHLSSFGRHEEAIAEARRSRELDPLSLIINRNVGRRLYFARQYQLAVEASLQTLRLDSDFYPAIVTLGRAYLEMGKVEEGVKELQRAMELSSGNPKVIGLLGHAYVRAGRKDDALKMLRKLQERSPKEFGRAFPIAVVYAGLGNRDRAFAWLEKAYQERSGWMVTIKNDPALDNLRSDPRFQDLLRRMNFPE